MTQQFTHLHLHTEYSVLDAMVKIEDLVQKAKSLKMNSIAITDHGNMSGALEFYSACKNNGIKPIIGIEAYIVDNMYVKQRVGGIREDRYHITLLAKNEDGYKNLTKLSTLAYIDGFYYKPRIDFKTLQKYSVGVICLSGCLGGELPSILKDRDLSKEEKMSLVDECIDKYVDVFKDDYYIEIMHHNFEEEKRVYNFLYRYAKKKGIKAVFTNDVHYLNKEDRLAHHALINSSASSKNMARERKYSGEGYWFKSLKEIKSLGIPNDLIDNTQEIANKCNLELDLEKMPKLKVDLNGVDTYSYIANVCKNQLKNKGLLNKEYIDRVKHELKIIKDLNFGNYFIVVKDYIDYAISKGIPVGVGRGSSCGSLIVYLLGITEIDPIKFGTKFSRFLNYSRKEFPDIDSDFSKKRRQEVIDYIVDKYGSEHCAQIATFGKMKPRSALRAVSRAMNIEPEIITSITKVVNENEFIPEPKFEGSVAEFERYERKYPELFKQARNLVGFNQNEGKHACGVVICEDKLDGFVPLKLDKEAHPMLQWNLESLSMQNFLIKFDILGLKNLDTINDTLKLIKKRHGIEINWELEDINDPEVYSMIKKGQTTGIFQLESYGMKQLAQGLMVDNFKELAALLALYRPGPLASGLTEMYVNNKFNLEDRKFFNKNDGISSEKIKKIMPRINNILKDTYGVIVFQEDVMNIAMELAGMTEVETDNLRRAVAKKKEDLMKKVKPMFINGCVKNDVDKQVATKIWDKIVEFAGYSFNMSHAISYAMISFRTAWLKCYYPAEYMVNLLNQEYGNESKQSRLLSEARRLGHEVVMPHVNLSKADFYLNDDEYIVFGLRFIKNIGIQAAETIALYAPYSSYDDFVTKMSDKPVNKKVIEALEMSECFDGLNKTVRPSLF